MRKTAIEIDSDEVLEAWANVADSLPRGSAKPARPQVEPPSIFGVADLLALDVELPAMLIEDLLPKAGASLMAGTSKVGKTLTAIEWLLCIARGTSVYGRYPVLEPGPVLLIEQDDPAGAASVKDILQKSLLSVDGLPFHLAAHLPFSFGPQFLEWLEKQILQLKLRAVGIDSYTAMRGPRLGGVDIVKAEQGELTRLDELGKRLRCALLLIHHASKGSAGMEWGDRAAGTFAMSAATESQINISRFAELESNSPERLIRVRGRHQAGVELVVRFRAEHLDHEFVLEGGAAAIYPLVVTLRSTFAKETFGPKELSHATGVSRATANRQIAQLYRAGVLSKRGFGEWVLDSCDTGVR